MFLRQVTPSNNETCGAGVVRGYQVGSFGGSWKNNIKIGEIIGDLTCVQTSERKQPNQRNLGEDGRLGGEKATYPW